jgi:DNA repair protein RecO (recombination protein O)
MALHKDEAIVLSKRAYGESDRIMHLFTLSSGKISAIAKGAGKSQKRFVNTLEPFNHIKVEYFEKQGRGMVRIENADIVATCNGIETSLKKVSTAAFFVEFVDRLTKERERHQELFHALEQALRDTKARDFAYRDVLRHQLKILETLGFMPNFHSCVYCGKDVPDERKVHFSRERGGILCPVCSRPIPHRTYSEGTMPWLVAVCGDQIDSSCEVRDGNGLSGFYYSEVLKQFEKEAREIMEGFISFHLDVEFKSYRILKSLMG